MASFRSVPLPLDSQYIGALDLKVVGLFLVKLVWLIFAFILVHTVNTVASFRSVPLPLDSQYIGV